MNEDFESGLRDLHDGAALAHASGDGFPTAAMAGRVRRNRRVRAGALSAVATVAVVGVAWAGTAVAGLGDPPTLQPAEPTVTETPGEYTGPACGTAIGDVPVFDEPPLVIDFTFELDVAGPVDPLTGRVVLAVADELDITFQPDGMLEGVDYSAVQDGVVVGYGRGALADGTLQALSGRQGVTALVTLPLRPCSGAGTLAAGDYQLFASMPVLGVGDDQDGPPDSRTILGGPWPFIFADGPSEESDDPVLWDPVAAAAPPCGEPFALELVDSPLIEVTGVVLIGSYDPGLDHFSSGDGSSHLHVSTWFQSETFSPINGTFTEDTYLIDAEGTVAFWDFHRLEDSDWDFGTRSPKFLLYEARNCLTGEPLAGTYRVVMAVTRDDPALPAPDVEVGELEPVEFPRG